MAALVTAVALGWNDVRAERSFRRLLAQGDRAMAAGQTSVAVEAFSGAVALQAAVDAALPEARRHISAPAGMGGGRAGPATGHDAGPTAPQPLERLGDVAAATGRLDEAERFLRDSLAHRGSGAARLVQARRWPGIARATRRGAIAALDGVAAARRLERRRTHYLKGVVLASTGNLDAARPAFERAIELAPAEVDARLGLADLHAARGRDREELALRESAAALDTAGPAALMNVARAYAAKGRERSGHRRADACRRPAPGSRRGADRRWDGCGSTWRTASRDTAALARALALLAPMAARPDASSEALTLYGRALLLDGSLIAAERVLERATLQYPVAPDAFALLAEAAARRGHRAAAELARRKQAALDVLTPRLRLPGFRLSGSCSF